MIFGSNEKLLNGNDAVIEAGLYAQANMFCGYPITPATEILENWANLANKPNSKIKFVQAEDEISAGFNCIGGLLAGAKAFTASAGVGHVLMQDPISMAEAMRLPFVGIIMQRGGPSTGTVIYGQQETTLACYGGNGEGLRIVYSTSTPQELYDYTIRAFNVAWKHFFPTFVLGDGYQSKMKVRVKLNRPEIIPSRPIIGLDGGYINIRNCYNFENQLSEVLTRNINEYNKICQNLTEWEEYKCNDAEIVIFSHGIVGSSAKLAVDILRTKFNKKVGLFRPITLRPFPVNAASRIASKATKILIAESSNGHFARLVKDNLYGLTRIDTLFKPVLAINPEDFIDKINNMNDDFWTEH